MMLAIQPARSVSIFSLSLGSVNQNPGRHVRPGGKKYLKKKGQSQKPTLSLP